MMTILRKRSVCVPDDEREGAVRLTAFRGAVFLGAIFFFMSISSRTEKETVCQALPLEAEPF